MSKFLSETECRTCNTWHRTAPWPSAVCRQMDIGPWEWVIRHGSPCVRQRHFRFFFCATLEHSIAVRKVRGIRSSSGSSSGLNENVVHLRVQIFTAASSQSSHVLTPLLSVQTLIVDTASRIHRPNLHYDRHFGNSRLLSWGTYNVNVEFRKCSGCARAVRAFEQIFIDIFVVAEFARRSHLFPGIWARKLPSGRGF